MAMEPRQPDRGSPRRILPFAPWWQSDGQNPYESLTSRWKGIALLAVVLALVLLVGLALYFRWLG
jgi:hypothetical protein